MNNKIPKIIIQTGNTRELAQFERATTQTVKSLNPDFEYIYFDDDDRNVFVARTFPEYERIYHGFKFPIQKYDFFRYLAVYHHGGFYFDLDILLSDSLSDLTNYNCVFPFERISISTYFLEKYQMPWDLGNYGFAAAPKHPFMKKVIEAVVQAQQDPNWAKPILRRIPRLYTDAYILCTSGPLLITRVYAENPDLHESIHLLMPDDICDLENWNKFGTYGIHLISGSWRKPKAYLQQKILNQFITLWEKRQIQNARRIGAPK